MSQEWKLVPVEPTCPKCFGHGSIPARLPGEGEAAYRDRCKIAAPVPPAGVEVETLAWKFDSTGEISTVTDRWDVAKHVPYPCRELVDRAHVTRLQAEVNRQTDMKEKNFAVILDQQQKIREMQSELTKARELIKESDDFFYVLIGHDSFARINHQHGKPWYKVVDDLREKLCGFLAHQSAPAAKADPRQTLKPELTMHELCGATEEEWEGFKEWREAKREAAKGGE